MFQRPPAAGPHDSLIEPRPSALPPGPPGRWMAERRLAPHQLAARFLLRDRIEGGRAVGYQLTRPTGPELGASLGGLVGLRHRHILAMREFVRGEGGSCWLIASPAAAPPEGQGAPMTLRDLASQRAGGRLGRAEALRATVQLVATSAWAHQLGFAHGPLTITDVLVTRRCVLVFELYALGASLAAPHRDIRALAALEARSLGRLAIRLSAGHEQASQQGVGGRLGRAAAAWVFAMASGDFADARQALRELPSGLAHLAQGPGSAGGSPAGGGSEDAAASASRAPSSLASASLS